MMRIEYGFEYICIKGNGLNGKNYRIEFIDILLPVATLDTYKFIKTLTMQIILNIVGVFAKAQIDCGNAVEINKKVIKNIYFIYLITI